MVNLGDITADGAHDPRELDLARPAFAGLGADVRFLPGNHDIGDNPIAPGAPNEHPLDLVRLEDYRRLFGPDRWSFDAGSWQIVGLNAQLLATGTDEEEEQFVWLAEQLRAGQGPLGLMLHKPLFRSGPADTEAHVRYVPLLARRRLLAALAKRDLRFVASGHAHQARALYVDGVDHLWVPSTAYCIPDAIQERIGHKIVGVVTLELSGGRPSLRGRHPGRSGVPQSARPSGRLSRPVRNRRAAWARRDRQSAWRIGRPAGPRLRSERTESRPDLSDPAARRRQGADLMSGVTRAHGQRRAGHGDRDDRRHEPRRRAPLPHGSIRLDGEGDVLFRREAAHVEGDQIAISDAPRAPQGGAAPGRREQRAVDPSTQEAQMGEPAGLQLIAQIPRWPPGCRPSCCGKREDSGRRAAAASRCGSAARTRGSLCGSR